MATVKITKKSMQQDEFIEGVFDFGTWLEAHWRRVAVGGGTAIAAVLLVVGWTSMRKGAVQDANRLLASGLEAFAPAEGSEGQAPPFRYAEALSLFEQAASKGGSQDVGDVARYMRARTLLALSRGAEAIPILEDLVARGNQALGFGAKASLAEAVEAAGQSDRAATLLREVATSKEKGNYPPDAAQMALGRLHERQGKKDEAKQDYDDLLARFPQSAFAADARQRSGALTEKSR